MKVREVKAKIAINVMMDGKKDLCYISYQARRHL